MSDRVPGRVQYSLMRQSVVGLLLAVVFIVTAAGSSFAAPGASGIPTSCSTAAGSNSWSAVSLTTRNTNSNPAWQWQASVATDPAAVLQGYGYAVLVDGTILATGQVAPTQLTYTHTATIDGDYQLYVWVLDGTDPTLPIADRCESAISEVDRTAPIIVGDSYQLTGNTATPRLTSDEMDVTYRWAVNAPTTDVTVSHDTDLTPIFTFLTDGTYVLTLAATDQLGNVSTVEMTVVYAAPTPTPTPPNPTPPVVQPTTPPAPVSPPAAPPAAVPASPQRHTTPVRSYCASEAAAAQVAVATAPAREVTNESAVAAPAVTDAQPSVSEQSTNQATIAPQARSQSSESASAEFAVLGLPWYWWLLGAAIVGTAIAWYKSGVYRKGPDDL